MKYRPLIIPTIIFLTLIFSGYISVNHFYISRSLRVYAERGEVEEEEEDEDEDRRNEETVTEEVVIYEPVEPVIRYKSVIDPGYNVDTDDDNLVDAIDPDPNVPQKEYYTDDDNDSVPNVLDKYPGEDDFLYIEFEDGNENGIVDFFEP